MVQPFSKIVLKEYGSIPPEDVRKYLVLMRDDTVQMGQLVDDLLRFAQPGRLPLNKQLVTTATVIEKALCDARQQAKGRSVGFCAGETPDFWGDPALMKQVFANLIQNAFKYTRKRAEAFIEIGSSKSGRERVFFVRDNGAGFDMDYAGNTPTSCSAYSDGCIGPRNSKVAA